MCGLLGFIGSPDKEFEVRWCEAQPLQYHRGPDNQSEKKITFNNQKLFLIGTNGYGGSREALFRRALAWPVGCIPTWLNFGGLSQPSNYSYLS